MQLIKTETALWNEDYYKEGSFTPTKATEESAGYDIRACIRNTLVINPGDCILVPLGFKCYIEDTNTAALVLPRSGLGAKEGIVLGNLVGLIDADYQEEWKCAVWNRNANKTVLIEPCMKLAQIIFVPVVHPVFKEVEEFTNSTKRIGGFGSTDKPKGVK